MGGVDVGCSISLRIEVGTGSCSGVLPRLSLISELSLSSLLGSLERNQEVLVSVLYPPYRKDLLPLERVRVQQQLQPLPQSLVSELPHSF